MKKRRYLAACIAVAASVATVWAREPVIDCTTEGLARPVCGFKNPEDLALLPSARFLVVSQMGRSPEHTPGTIAFFDLKTEAITIAFPPADVASLTASEGWGDRSCPGPPVAFSPHGLSLAKRPDGKLQLLVVNHGGRESVELFEVADDPPQPGLTWRGCVVAPDDAFLNDVAALPDGGFVTTHMFPRGTDTRAGMRAMFGLVTGYVLEWHAGEAMRKVPHSDSVMPNGIEVTPDGEHTYFAQYVKNEVTKIARKSGELEARVSVTRPDNLSWSPNGGLLIASHDARLSEILECRTIERGACGTAFSIYELDPVTLIARKLYENEGPPMGAGTAAVRLGNELFIGSNAGDRILRVKLLQ